MSDGVVGQYYCPRFNVVEESNLYTSCPFEESLHLTSLPLEAWTWAFLNWKAWAARRARLTLSVKSPKDHKDLSPSGLYCEMTCIMSHSRRYSYMQTQLGLIWAVLARAGRPGGSAGSGVGVLNVVGRL